MTASEFCSNAFPWRVKIEWIGRVGTLDLGKTRFARISLSSRCCDGCPTQGDYNGFLVEIIDTNAGKIDSARFRFDDLLSGSRHHHVISHVGWKWYATASAPAPENTSPISEAIENYAIRFDEGI